MDVHVPRAITDALRRRGVDVLTVQQDGTDELDDAALLDRARELGRVLFTRDEDFLLESANRLRTGKPFPGLIYAHQMRVTIGRCVNDLELMARVCEPSEMANRVEHLPLR
jgi:predicted nuclease of predicted toxin-antitoxin system